MEIFIYSFAAIWVIGGLYTCGVHYGVKEVVRDIASPDQLKKIDTWPKLQYALLMIGWPIYLGYKAC
jgi:hypothetical protein